MTSAPLTPASSLIVCPYCDALHELAPVAPGARALCRRCGSTLIRNRPGAPLLVSVLSITSLILMSGGVFFPFLGVSSYGMSNESSVFGAALAFHGDLRPLSFAVLLMIVLLPVTRCIALVYTLLPLALGRPPLRHAVRVFRVAERLRPWSMVEVFVIGTAVALVKVAGLANITLGPAFWAFAAMIFTVAIADGYINRWSIWSALETRNGS
ncbi:MULTISPECIES: paraquat-inducible protein A [unclassified Haematobacter]|uniref:paraquat-inducible protein A n=1 Tax=unclassified Haematobacter TaxID=2640585 RepID=UPI0025BC96A0|nr:MULTISPECIES: paraquat-inducible protein A [unclassified Haematobacter]